MNPLLLTLLLAIGFPGIGYSAVNTKDCAWLVNHIRDHERTDHARLFDKNLRLMNASDTKEYKKHMRSHERAYEKNCGKKRS